MRNLLILTFAATLLALIPAAAQTSQAPVVSGRVIRSAATPAKAVERVEITELNGSTTGQEAAVSADGSFRFTKVRPGTYRVQIETAAGDWASEAVTIQVVDRDVTGITLTINAIVNAKWTVAVEGGGLRPPVTMAVAQYRGGQGYRQIALNDATTERPIVEGEYRVSWTSLPAGYYIKSVTAGTTDVLASPLKIDGTGPAPEVSVLLGVQSPPPWVKVSGRMVSVSPGPLPSALRVILEEPSTLRRTPEMPLKEDGSFEFPMVLPGTYRAVTLGAPSIQVLGPASIVVPSGDLSGLQIAVSARKEVRGKITVEGTEKRPPTILLIVSNRVQSTVPVEPDGSFKAMLAVGSSPFNLAAPGYTVRSVTYGASNLLQQPLTVGATDTAELRVTVTANPSIDDDIIIRTLPLR